MIIIHRRDTLRAEKILQERAFKNEKISFIWNSIVDEVIGENKIKQISLKNTKDGSLSLIDIDGMFIYIGLDPNTAFISQVEKDNSGYIITDESMKTNVPGIVASGDCRQKTLRQVATAIGDGAVAAYTIEKYLDGLNISGL